MAKPLLSISQVNLEVILSQKLWPLISSLVLLGSDLISQQKWINNAARDGVWIASLFDAGTQPKIPRKGYLSHVPTPLVLVTTHSILS